jgi:hypothetical protein
MAEFIANIVKKLNKAAPRFEGGARFETCCYDGLILCGLTNSPTTHLLIRHFYISEITYDQLLVGENYLYI